MKKDKEKKEKKPRTPWSKKKKRNVILGGIAVVACGAVFAVKAAGGDPVLPVQTVAAYKGTVEATLSTSGKVESETVKTYFAPASARILTVSGNAGEMVEAGTQVVAFDLADLENEKKKADLQVSQASNSYQSAVQESNENQSEYSEATIGLDELKAMKEAQEQYVQGLTYQLEDDTTAKKRDLKEWIIQLQEELNYQQTKAGKQEARKGEVSESTQEVIQNIQNQISEAQNELELMSNEGNLSEKQRQIDAEKKKLEDMTEEIQKRESKQTSSETGIMNNYSKAEKAASVETAKLSAQEAEENLQAASAGVSADFSGVITEVSAVEGSTVQEGAQLFTLSSSENVKVVVEASKYDLEQLKEGQSADIEIAGKTYEGTISKINRLAQDNQSGNPVVKTEIHINNPDEGIFLGVEAKVTIHTNKAENVVVVPYNSVNLDMEGDFCYVVRDGVVAKQRVTTGVASDTEVEITEGIQEGDQVITESYGTLTEGMKVAPIAGITE